MKGVIPFVFGLTLFSSLFLVLGDGKQKQRQKKHLALVFFS